MSCTADQSLRHTPNWIRIGYLRVLLGWIMALASASAAEPSPTPTYLYPGTRKMTARLEEIAKNIRPLDHPFANSNRAAIFRSALEEGIVSPDAQQNLPRLFDLQAQYAVELLNSGQTVQAIEEFERFVRVLKAKNRYGKQNRSTLRTLLATSYLRLGEQENCLENHTTDSCLLPIREGGVHRLPRGSRGALNILHEQLLEFPDDLRARWLFNLGAMTLGEYPDKVPSQWLIPPASFASDYDIKRFPDISSVLGLDLDTLSGSVVMEDFDNDGYLDLMISARGELDQLRFFRNNADGSFTDRTRESGLIGETGGLNLVQADYNNDGFTDLLVLRGAWQGTQGHHPCSLLRNNGNGTFDDVTEEVGLLRFKPTQTAVWFDYNRDGWLDLFIGNETTPGDTNVCELFRSNGDGTFTECAKECGVAAVGYVKAVACGDFNNDGWPDLFLSSRGEKKILFRNDGPQDKSSSPKAPWKFTNVAQSAGVEAPLHSFPAWFFDYDNDGWVDIFVCGYGITNVADVAADYLRLPNQGEKPRLYHNERNGTFKDVTQAAHLDRVVIAMAGNFGDLDNDGWLDFYLGTGDPDLATLVPNRMFRNDRGQQFQDVTTSAGFGHLQKGHGIAFGDLDNDGDQDIYEVMGGALEGDHYRNVLFENPGHGNHWITLKLVGHTSNRSALGARIRIVVSDGGGRERSIYKWVSTGGSFGGSPLRQEIGLGDASAIRRIEITWPSSGVVEQIDPVPMDHFYQLHEGRGKAERWDVRSLKWVKTSAPHHHSHP